MQSLRDFLRSALMISVCALLFTPAELAAQTKKIVFGYSTVGAMAAGSWMAKEIGAYEKYGIDAEMIYISSGPTTVQALLGGDIVGGVAATNAVIAAVLRGAPLVSVLSTANRPYHRFWVQPEISRIGRSQGQDHRCDTLWFGDRQSDPHAAQKIRLGKRRQCASDGRHHRSQRGISKQADRRRRHVKPPC